MVDLIKTIIIILFQLILFRRKGKRKEYQVFNSPLYFFEIDFWKGVRVTK